MGLLRIDDLAFEDFLDEDNRPPYAIASHRWSENEATYRNVKGQCNTDGKGYRKVKAFARYIQQHLPEIMWLWIDTCCINKASDAELSYSINSMSRWYHSAEICIAYMADVDTADDHSSFEASVWLKRGWTLQELVASRVILFVTSA